MTQKEQVDILRQHASQLAEHFDAVQIIATRYAPENDGTVIVSWGAGNWFARYGSVGAWLRKEDATLDVEGISEADDDDGDEGAE